MHEQVDAIADGLWRRLRDVILTTHRLERFAFSPEEPDAGPMAGRLGALLADEEGRGAVARDLALRAFGAATDAVNFRILKGLGAAGPVALGDLAGEVGLPPLALAERVSDLVQVGLAARLSDSDAAACTPAGGGCVAVIEAVASRLAERCRAEMPLP